ncbi:CBS domain-containing protein [Chitinophaga ginsengisegetis]|jgi:acetoin utilization protein AcuB|uniref:CBS domain-containing protein n=1 Tax=Chitinophaga ginsengisegetis TaxID=393003 RepID=A0A1T5P5N0_9BACT|nr:CBS domain-containing protein [Chitinophaga ginsengisegetis]MDR6566510.1 CBS domain-containing protein [Chitinophaga ginsengisegetis]MDR6646240.1 CBS domain-containing protein [Chitinophaga ginsengisegetis]MDR6651167.1 CBS domain-containing protein [Chitinophaga ginsengisegetis]SKD07956.1 CBS domain-containing protein [Chitinophaga ginsengisegetis]
MIARELISSVPVLHPSDSGTKALRLMNEYHLTQLPMVVDSKYLALVEEDDIMDLEDPDVPLESMEYSSTRPAVMEYAHLFEALKLFYDFKLSALPVVTKENEYLGIITKDNLLAALARYNGVKEPGGIIAFEVDPRDYALSEIARIAESNDVTLLSVNTITNPVTGKLEVVLKTNRQELQGLVATFERFNYVIKYIFAEEPEEELLKKNYDLLMNYIGM